MECITDSAIRKSVLEIEGELSVSGVSILSDQLISEIDRSDYIELDLRGVTGCDTAAIQLLICAGRTASGMGKQVVIRGASSELQAAAERIGVDMEAYVGMEASNE